jgi:hypothetical protein
MLRDKQGEQKGQQKGRDIHSDRHASLNTRILEAQIHLHARDETVQLPPGIEKRKEVRKEWRVQSLGLILPG